MQVENGILQLMSALVKNSASLPQTQQSQGGSFGDLLDDRLQGAQNDASKAQQNTQGNSQQEDGSSPIAEKPQQPQEDNGSAQTVPEDQQPAASLWAASMMAPAQWNLQAPETAAPVVETATPVAAVPVEVQTVPQVAETAQGLQTSADQLAAQPQEATPQETGEAQPQVEQPVQQTQQPAQAQVNTQAGGQQSSQDSGLEQPDTQQDSLDVQVQEAPVETSQAVFGQVESAPVKVSDIPQAQETEQTPDVEKQISQGLTQALKQGDSKVEIQLNPASLGNVRIEVTRSAEGALYVVLTAEHQQTQGLLERHAAGLQAMLMGTSSTENVEVHVQRQQEGQQAANQSYDGSSGNGRESQQQEHRRQQTDSQDFLQQLRLGLVPAQVTNL